MKKGVLGWVLSVAFVVVVLAIVVRIAPLRKIVFGEQAASA